MKTLDELEAVGHTLALVAGPLAGHSTYWCESCGVLVATYQGDTVLFQMPAGLAAREDEPCPSPVQADGTLREKLAEMHAALDRLLNRLPPVPDHEIDAERLRVLTED